MSSVKNSNEERVYLVNDQSITAKQKISFKDNPKRKGSAAHSRYEKYSKARTWEQYLKLNEGKHAMADARYDQQKGFLEITE